MKLVVAVMVMVLGLATWAWGGTCVPVTDRGEVRCYEPDRPSWSQQFFSAGREPQLGDSAGAGVTNAATDAGEGQGTPGTGGTK